MSSASGSSGFWISRSGKTDLAGSYDPRWHSLIAPIALQRAEAIREREQRDTGTAVAQPEPKKTGWFG